ncbi:hypothetical protein [Streptomyces cinnamoneus]|uniref:hypothetical protein n=1 Tax=Streptomyces cinnamoneus TaxID=53446 RepID=UPI00167EFAB5|nr:hypothetical protein [Streptomyces cinnamoneus]
MKRSHAAAAVALAASVMLSSAACSGQEESPRPEPQGTTSAPQGTTSAPSTPGGAKVDLSHEAITDEGMGPLRLGLSRAEAEKVVGASIPDRPGGPRCKDLAVDGGPQGLILRFAQDKLVAIYVLPSASESLSTDSEVHRGTSRLDAMRSGTGSIGSRHLDDRHEEIVLGSTVATSKGNIIKFGILDEKVDTFIAGQRDFADLHPCGGS